MKKRLLTLLAVLLSAVTVAALGGTAVAAAKVQYTGVCQWTLDGTVLTISGNGETGAYEYTNPAPWGTAITEAVINEGVTTLGGESFSECASLTKVSLPSTLKAIDGYAFYGCTSLETIEIPYGVTDIGGVDYMKEIRKALGK